MRPAQSGFRLCLDVPGGPVDRSPPANGKDTGSIPGVGGLHKPRNSWAGVPNCRARSGVCELRLLSVCSATRDAATGSSLCAAAGQPRALQPERALPTAAKTQEDKQKIAKREALKNVALV